MLALEVSDDSITYTSGLGMTPSVTRYAGEYWDKTASDLVCGIADVFQDVGIIVTGSAWNADEEKVRAATDDRWVSVAAQDRRNRSVWSVSDEYGWLFVPWCREAVEDVMSWTIPYLRADKATEESLTTVFQGCTAFRERLDSQSWHAHSGELFSFVRERCLDDALFTMRWGWAVWKLYPGKIELRHLAKLADPVVARINAVNTD